MELDLATAPNGRSARGYQELFALLAIPTTAEQVCGQGPCIYAALRLSCMYSFAAKAAGAPCRGAAMCYC